jgi:hypothetical protein
LAALALLAPPDAEAQWVWRDAEGRVTASDRPPPASVPERDIINRPGQPAPARRVVTAVPAAEPANATAATSAPAPRDAALEREVEARRRAAYPPPAARDRAESERLAAQRAENCSRARGHLAALDSGQRMARTNERGEREVLDDRGRAEEARRARAVIASDCR